MRLLLFLASLPLFALQDGVFNGSKYLQFTGASVSLNDYRIEFRMKGFSAGGTQGIFGNNNNGPHGLLVSGTTDLRFRDWSGNGDHVTISLAGRTDVRVRFQRFSGTGVRLLEVWNADGSGYAAGQVTNTSTSISFGQTQYVGSYYGASSECTCTIGYVRVWSTTVATGSPAPPDSVTTPADILDLELEGSTADSSGRATSISTTGGALSYATTTLFAPSAIISAAGSARAGAALSLSAAGSANLTDDQPLSYFWTAVSFPTAAPLWSSRTSVTPSVTLRAAGTYALRLRVCDSVQCTIADQSVGAVATDSQGVVLGISPTLETILGPTVRSGSAPWSWFDSTELAVADAIIATIPATPSGTVTGTVTLTNGSKTVTGSGTSFQSVSACNETDSLYVYYPIDGGGGALGRRAYGIKSCESQTSLTLSENYSASSTAAGVAFKVITNDANAQWVNGSNNWNYYDAVVALYRLYYRTGNVKYRDAARSLADKWWVYPLDGGRGSLSGARSLALFGVMLRAADGKSEYWPGIMDSLATNYNVLLQGYYSYQPNADLGEIREQGYAALFTQLAAILHPDSSTRSTWQTNANTARDYFIANQLPSGGWKFPLDPGQNYYGSGNFPWQGAFLMRFLQLNYAVTSSSTAKASLKAYIDYVGSQGVDASNDGGYYEDNVWTLCPDYGAEKSGLVSVTNGSTSVTASPNRTTNFTGQYNCNGTDSIVIQDSTGFRRAYTVASCASASSMTLGSAYAGATSDDRRILRYSGTGITPPAACHNSYGTDSSGKKESRSLLHVVLWGWGWAFSEGYGSAYKTTGDRLFAQALGLGGVGNDGVVGHYNDVVSGGTAPSYLAGTYLSKYFGEGGGASGVHPYLAWRLGGAVAPIARSISVRFSLTGVANAAKLRATVTLPSGETASATCTTSPCAVSNLDGRQGNTGMLRVEYLSSDNIVLAAGDQQSISIQ